MEDLEIDLFDHSDLLPQPVLDVLSEFSHKDQTYKTCKALLKALKPLGYEFDYYLDAQPYNLRKIV